RRNACRGRPERHFQECAASERGAAVPVLLLLGGVPATDRRRRRAALDACARQGEAWPQAVWRDQDHEGGRRRGREAGRGDQGALQQAVWRLAPPKRRGKGKVSPGGYDEQISI